MYKIAPILLLPIVAFSTTLYFHQSGGQVTLTPMESKTRSSNKDIDNYTTSNGSVVGVGDTILVTFYNTKNVKELMQKYDIKLKEKLTDTIYVFSVEDKSLTIDTANALFDEKSVRYSTPDFFQKKIAR